MTGGIKPEHLAFVTGDPEHGADVLLGEGAARSAAIQHAMTGQMGDVGAAVAEVEQQARDGRRAAGAVDWRMVGGRPIPC